MAPSSTIVTDARGESYKLYTLSGVSREQFAQFPLPRNTALFEPTFRGTGVVRLADVRHDPRHGMNAPYYGLPPGHLPVTSYLAVPVVSRTGEVLGGLFFGHQEAGVFTDRHERLVVGLAAQAAVALDNARLFAAAQREIMERTQIEAVLRESEQRYRQLVHALPAAVYPCDTEGRVTMYNEAAVALWGREPVVGQEFWCGSWRLYTPDGTPLPLEQCPLAVVLREGRSLRGQEVVIERPDGTRRHVLLYPDPIRNAAGEVVGAVNMLVDLTERRQAEEALRESEQRYRRLFDTAGVSLWEEDFSGVKALIEDLKAQGVTDFQSFFAAHPEVVEQAIALVHVVDVNTATVRMFGARGKPDLRGSLQRILVPERRPGFVGQLLAIAAGQTFYETETLVHTLQGARMHVLLTITFPPPDAPFSSVLVSVMDITIRKQAEEALRGFNATLAQQVAARTAEAEARAQELAQVNAALREEMATRQQAETRLRQQQEVLLLREKLAAMGTLLASVAHELNNPLAVILMQADLLRAEVSDGPLAEYAVDITEAATRCERLVRQFLTLARQHVPERTTVDLHALLAPTLELLAPALRVDNIALDLQLASEFPRLWADPHQLQQVVVNLVTNAQQALRDVMGSRQLTLTTRWDQTRAVVTLEVADNGPGIPPAMQARIFEPFFTTKPAGGGTGLGLPLCQGIIGGHGGTISLRSAPGNGTTFRVELPVGAGSDLSPNSASQDDTSPSVPTCTILLVDDEAGIVKALPRLLRRDGHTVDTAANGRLAMAKLQERAYDLILCDLRMPELDGPGLYRTLEQQAPHLCRRFIFLTGDTLSPDVQRFLEQSGVPRLTKPFTAAEVRQAVAQVLQAV